MAGDRVAHFLPGVAAVRKDVAQPWEALVYSLEHIDGAVPVLNVGSMHENEDQEATGVGQDVALAPLDLFARVIAANPTLLVALTDWLSMIPAQGEASRPSISRRLITSVMLIASNRPAPRHA